MADVKELKVEPRDRAGKGSSRAARRAGLVPAVIYGDKKAPAMINIKRNELIRLLNKGGFMTHVLELKSGGKDERVLPRDLQRHPVSDEPLHVDFLRISKGAKIIVEVPMHFVGEEESPGLTRGGVLNVVRHMIEVNAPMDAIPEGFTLSLEGLDIGDGLHASSIQLPEGVELTVTDRDFTIATIAAPTLEPVEEEPEEELEEGEEGEEGEGEEGEGEEGEASAEDKAKEEGGE